MTRNPPQTGTLEVTIRPEVLGIDTMYGAVGDEIAHRIGNANTTFRDTVAALMDIHRADNDDKRELREKYANMGITVRRTARSLILRCSGVPADSLLDGDIPERQKRQISQAVRDLVLEPHAAEAHGESAAVSRVVRSYVGRTPLLQQAPRPRCFVWGGHSASRDEYDFAKEVGYWDALANGTEFITGCGPGVMKAPFKGAVVAYGKQDFDMRGLHRDFIGFSEQGIIAAEAPNGLVSELVIFPDVEKRMEAFIRASHRGRIHPGGAGTAEELLTFLGIKAHPANAGLAYPLDLVERPGGEYFRHLTDWLRTCFGDALDDLFEVHVGPPRRYAEHVRRANTNLDIYGLWNDALYVPPEMQKPFRVTFDSMEALDLSRVQSPFDLLVNLRRFFSALVHLAVKEPDASTAWGGELPRIQGDREVLEATDELIRWFDGAGRMKLSGDYQRPYRIS
ncbi:pyrimidine/purine nucleotide monophosphate nucleosidase domain-containing protein [Thiohalorhabdus sp.]|uniref:pyrimidine/purine nucleotide monophosphate nucleosidase domain-containing protein n=1 Tax=Thiohalorhabdus sp. TaxID=3094134 RepID=UPI002FC2BF20